MLTLIDTYQEYKKRNTKVYPYEVYRDIILNYINYLYTCIIDYRETIVLPNRCGTLSITSIIPKIRFTEEGRVMGLAPDWGKTRKLWAREPEAKDKKTILYCTNEHSNKKRYKFTWSIKDVYGNNKRYFQFKVVRSRKHQLTAAINNNIEY